MFDDSVAGDRRHEPVHRADELGDVGRTRIAVHLGRRADLLDAAVVQDGHAVGDGERLLLVVRDVERRDPELELDAADLLAELHPHLRVQGRQRLVEKQDPGLDRERSGKRDSLLHAAGQLMRIPLPRISEADQLEQIGHALAPLRLALSPDLQPVLDVLLGGHVREQAVGLEHHAHVAPVWGHPRKVLPVDDDPTRVRAIETRNEP